MKHASESEAFKDQRALIEARAGWLVDAAFADILAGRLDSINVHEALKLGTHEDYPKLRQAHDDAARAERACGVTEGRRAFPTTKDKG